jgi:transposase
METMQPGEQSAEQAEPSRSEGGLGGSLHPRLAWMMCYKETQNVQAVCRKFGISRKTFYKWLKRYQSENGASQALTDRSRRPHHFPRATSEENIRILKEAREKTGYGQRRLRAYLEKHHKITLSERTIWKILKREDELQRGMGRDAA